MQISSCSRRKCSPLAGSNLGVVDLDMDVDSDIGNHRKEEDTVKKKKGVVVPLVLALILLLGCRECECDQKKEN